MTASQSSPSIGLHHVAYATRCSRATYAFYHEKLGMPLVHTENHLVGKGYFKHFFFDMGAAQYLAFFEIHNVGEQESYRTDPSTGLGMPIWVNHIAFKVASKDVYDTLKQRITDNGLLLLGETDHDFCQSMYLVDPNMLMIEFAYDTDAALFGQDPAKAYHDLFEMAAEDIPESARKGRNSSKVKIYVQK